MDKVIVGIGGALAIIFVLWFFLNPRKKKAQEAKVGSNIQDIEIVVDGGYQPDTVKVKKGIPVRLNFLRKDPSSCLEEVVIPDYSIRKKLTLNEITPIEFTPQTEKEIGFECGMGMFHGKIIVE